MYNCKPEKNNQVNYYGKQIKHFDGIHVAICMYLSVANRYHNTASQSSCYHTFVTLSESKFISVKKEAAHNSEEFWTQYKTTRVE